MDDFEKSDWPLIDFFSLFKPKKILLRDVSGLLFWDWLRDKFLFYKDYCLAYFLCKGLIDCVNGLKRSNSVNELRKFKPLFDSFSNYSFDEFKCCSKFLELFDKNDSSSDFF